MDGQREAAKLKPTVDEINQRIGPAGGGNGI